MGRLTGTRPRPLSVLHEHVLPDYLIIGASKTGTTFLSATLRQHPAIRMYAGEVHYFDWNYERGPHWYRAHFPRPWTRHKVLRREGGFATGERSPNYLFDPNVPSRVRELLPQVRLIALIREPVARAYSHFQHERRRGVETLSFRDAVVCERRQRDQRAAGEEVTGRHRFYLGRGLYAEQLERWFALFERSQIHVIQSERMRADPIGTVCEVHRFLGLPPKPPENVRPVHVGEYDPMPVSMKPSLRAFFEPDVARLGELLPAAPQWW